MSSSKRSNFLQSPLSSAGVGESADGSPETKMTAFSPEDTPIMDDGGSRNLINLYSSPLKANSPDPFVSTGTKSEQKLSATATAFQPFVLKYGSISIPLIANGSGPLPGTMQYLEKVVASNPSILGSDPLAEPSQCGIFSTDTGASRCLEVNLMYDGDAKKLVLDFLEVSGIPCPSVCVNRNADC